jgi:hypothetical protein
MPTFHTQVMVPPPVPEPRMARVVGTAAAWLCARAAGLAQALARRARARRGGELRALASEVECEQPVLAAELRGIAMHWEAFERTAR